MVGSCSDDIGDWQGAVGQADEEEPTKHQLRMDVHEQEAYRRHAYRKSQDPGTDPYFREWVSKMDVHAKHNARVSRYYRQGHRQSTRTCPS